MPLLNLLRAELAFGTHPLLDRAELVVEPGERIGLIGRNGTGKSSLLEVVAGKLALDDGELQRTPGLRVAVVRQEPELPQASTSKPCSGSSACRRLPQRAPPVACPSTRRCSMVAS